MQRHLHRRPGLHLAAWPELGPVGAEIDRVAPETATSRLDPGGPRHARTRVNATAALLLLGIHGGRESKGRARGKTLGNGQLPSMVRTDRLPRMVTRGCIVGKERDD